MMFSVIVKCETFTKHISSQRRPWISFHQVRLLLQCNRWRPDVRQETNEARKPFLFSEYRDRASAHSCAAPRYRGSLRKSADRNLRPGLGLPSRVEFHRPRVDQ